MSLELHLIAFNKQHNISLDQSFGMQCFFTHCCMISYHKFCDPLEWSLCHVLITLFNKVWKTSILGCQSGIPRWWITLPAWAYWRGTLELFEKCHISDFFKAFSVPCSVPASYSGKTGIFHAQLSNMNLSDFYFLDSSVPSTQEKFTYKKFGGP